MVKEGVRGNSTVIIYVACPGQPVSFHVFRIKCPLDMTFDLN